MKANEIEDGKVLMIGDLVVGCIETDIVGEATYKILCKVTDINHYGDVICEALKPFPDELDWQDGDDFSWIEPIPLTAEILEKNGFEKTQIHGEKQDDIFQCFDGEIIIEVGTYDPNFILIHYRYETPDGINSGELSSIVKVDGGKFYLHELQHALRLCGIEKEIIL